MTDGILSRVSIVNSTSTVADGTEFPPKPSNADMRILPSSARGVNLRE